MNNIASETDYQDPLLILLCFLKLDLHFIVLPLKCVNGCIKDEKQTCYLLGLALVVTSGALSKMRRNQGSYDGLDDGKDIFLIASDP